MRIYIYIYIYIYITIYVHTYTIYLCDACRCIYRYADKNISRHVDAWIR